MVRNIHYRDLRASLSEVGALIDGLSSQDDKLWPHENWPPMIMDRPLGIGASGGHSTIGYVVEQYEPGKSICFKFTAPQGFIGTHTFDAEEISPGIVRLRHTILMKPKGKAILTWTFMIRWIHDALIEDGLEKAVSFFDSKPWQPCQRSGWVKFLIKLKKRSETSASS